MIIPIRDINPSKTFPIVTLIIIAANAVIFIAEITLPSKQLSAFFMDFGFIPARATGLAEEFPTGSLLHSFTTLFTCMFVHAGWAHAIGNMWILWLFGDNVEDRLGHLTFLIFYISAGLAAGITHLFMHPASTIPAIGASGAVAGVMAAYVLMYPKARIVMLFWFFFIFIKTFLISAWVFIGIWFAIQLFSGVGSLASGQAGGIAFWAHIGGFSAGVFMIVINRIRKI
ncbi:MAG: rhomboid family intramembrane serine protease [Candidatus Electryonea clarkiae]|nr:rhomboid family intramembrane serine protease [Candidatus Electryonea clarkiae]MDP8286460.1 rhomboid family intramembrane serine protease [Candidatus Electryonea clarkiae]